MDSLESRLGDTAAIPRGESGFELGFSAIEPADHVGANRPRGDLGRRGLLALAVGALLDRADETALDEHVRAFLDRGCNILGQPGAKDGDAVPLGIRGPLVLGVFPSALRSDGEHGELQTVAFRLTLLRVRTNEPDESY
jgi:hypothetical protein